MKTININELQARISRVIRSVEEGEVYEVMRYSRPVAVIMPKGQKINDNSKCNICREKLDQIISKLDKASN